MRMPVSKPTQNESEYNFCANCRMIYRRQYGTQATASTSLLGIDRVQRLYAVLPRASGTFPLHLSQPFPTRLTIIDVMES
jgi:hypothetical protein